MREMRHSDYEQTYTFEEDYENSFYPRMSYFDNQQKRSLVFWRLCLTILIIISSSGCCRSAVDNVGADAFSTSSSSSTSARKTLDQEIGSPSELAWQAWLLVENKNGGQFALDSSNILRRITPKSIFIAPELVACPSGYSSDGKGVCKPDPIKIDEDAQRQFFLKRLNALYGKFGNNRKKPEAAGPLQINIPISLPTKVNSPETQPVQPQSQQEVHQPTHKIDQPIITSDHLAMPVVISKKTPAQLDSNIRHGAVAVVVYKVSNNTKEQKESAEKEKATFYLENSNFSVPKKNAAQISHVVQVTEIIDEFNETYTGVVDYKMPINLKPIFNKSDIFDETNVGGNRYTSEKKVNGPNSSEDSSPMVVLLLSPTKLPSITSADPIYHMSMNQKSKQNDDTMTEDKTKSESDVTETAVEPIESTLQSTKKAYTQDRLEDETQTEQHFKDREDYDYTTDEIYQDDFGESEDELLKPGETGMMISTKNQDLIRSKNHKLLLSTPADTEDLTSTMVVDTTIMPTFPTTYVHSFDASDSTVRTDAADYTQVGIMTTQTTEIPNTIVTMEPSIKDSTIFAVTLPRVKHLIKAITQTNRTQMPDAINAEAKDEVNLKETLETERDLATEPEVIFSTQGSHSITSYGRKRLTHPVRIMKTPLTSGLFEDVISRTELPPLSDFQLHIPLNDRRQKPLITINDKLIHFKNDGNIPFDFKDQMAESSKTSSADFKNIHSFSNNDESSSYVRFPERSPESRSQQYGYARFPSDGMNSIHNPENYKDHLLFPYRSRDEYIINLATSTESSVFARQKSPTTHWRIPLLGVRMDRQQQQSEQQMQMSMSSDNQRQQKQKPMLLRFWARMPLVRDLSFYPITSHGSHNEPIGGQEETYRLNSRFSTDTTSHARRVNYYKKLSSHDVNRLLHQ